MENRTRIVNIISEAVVVKQNLLKDKSSIENIEKAVQLIIACYAKGGTVWFCGNGGSAADAQHLAAELSGRFYYDRPPLSAEALHVNTSYLTAVANDYSYEVVYSRYLKGAGKINDVLIGISTSGNSKNILNAIDVANEIGISTICLTGQSGGKMKEKSSVSICVPSSDTPRIQECHIIIGHIICELVEESIYPK